MRTFITLVFIATFAAACSKGSNCCPNDSLVGKWMLRQTLVSPGPMGQWMEYCDCEKPAFLHFRPDGRLEQDGISMVGDNYDRYLVRPNKIVFYKLASTDSLQTSYSFTTAGLEIMFPCIEPCGIRLERQD